MPAIDLNVLLIILIAANVVLIVASIVLSRVRRRRTRAPLAQRPPAIPRDDLGVTLAPSAIRRGSTSPAEADPLGREIDRLTGLLGPTDWNRLIADEDIRHARYRRPATVVVMELGGFDRLVAALGQLAADRVIVALTDVIRRHARKSDHVARLGPNRFGVLMPETDEVAAINYVERVRQASDLWLEAGAISLRLAIGWASPVADSSVVDAEKSAIERMYGEVHRGALRERGPGGNPESFAGLKGAPSAI
jgi:diguanylate cyclase (GGDEF)-like protein